MKALNEAGIHAAFINSSLTEAQIRKALNRAGEGLYKIIYVAPERLESYDFTDYAAIVSAFTATATKEVKEDILCILNLVNPNVTVTGFDRENLYYSVEKNVDRLFEGLRQKGVAVVRYHAGMDNDMRKKSQEDF